jgi:hypothetical protein
VIVRDANGQALAYVYFEDDPQRQMSMKRLSSEEARRIAANPMRYRNITIMARRVALTASPATRQPGGTRPASGTAAPRAARA